MAWLRTLSRPFGLPPVSRLAERPFGRLVAHFLARMVRGGQGSASSEFELGLPVVLGLLAAPGAFFCFLMLDKYSSFLNWMRGSLRYDLYLTSATDKYLFISVAMAVTGIMTVLKWDQILPDSQDYLNLAPLPIRPRMVLLANAAAIAIAVTVVALDVNAIPSLLFPMFVTAALRTSFAGFLEFVAIHAATVLLASLFTICAMFAVLGTLSAVLPRETFRACSSWVRGLLLVALLALLASGFAGPALIGGIERFPDSPLRFLPSLWYTGLYQSMQHRASPALAGLARWGLDATLAAAVWMMIAYALSYRRRFAGVLEGGRRPSQQTMIRVLLALLDRFAPRRPGFGRACHRFAVRALLRNEAHRLVLAVAIGLGWLIAFQDISGAPPDGAGKVPALALLQAPLAVAYLLVLGLRLAFELPCGVAANWVFRAVLNPRENETIGVARRLVLGFLTLVVLAPALAFYWWRWGPAVSALQTLYVLGLSVLLAEFQFAGYRKVPLTCPMPGFRDNLLMLCLIQFLGYQAFTRVGAALEQWMFADPWRFLLLPAAMAWAWRWNLRRLQNAREAGELEEGVTFENAPIRAVERLNLSGGA